MTTQTNGDELERQKFLSWLEDEHGLYGEDVEWQPERNCFSIFGVHLAWCAWRAAVAEQERLK